MRKEKNLNKCKKNLKLWHIATILLVFTVAGMGIFIYKQKNKYILAMQNNYNSSFYQMIGYVQSMENYLAKASISASSENGAETLTEVWKDANLAAICLSQLPIKTEGLSKTSKFLNQVSDYSYALSRKNINKEDLTQEDLDNISKMHEYSIELEQTLNQIGMDLTAGNLSWAELANSRNVDYAQQVDNITFDSFNNIEENFNEYAGLIYDGAYSEHINKIEKKGLTGENITEDMAINKAKEIIGENRIQDIKSNGFIENADIPYYDISIKLKDSKNELSLALSKKGAHIVYMNNNREVEEEKLSQEEANQKGKEFLEKLELKNMKETYYMKEAGTVTINYAYKQNEVIVYPDLIKLKIALDNGEVLGMETSGYLNSHEERNIENPNISIEEAKQNLNKNIEIISEGLAIIPTKWKTELLCYEFKGTVKENEFLVYINANTGKEENILVIINTPNGTLTM